MIIDDNTTYMVRVKRPAPVGPITYLPREEIQMTGRRLKRLIELHGEDVIAYANPG